MSRSRRSQSAAQAALATLMTEALIDIRATAYNGTHVVEIDGVGDQDRIRLLADLFHNVSWGMRRAAETDGEFRHVLDQLWQWNPDFGRKWLEAVVRRNEMDSESDLFAAWR